MKKRKNEKWSPKTERYNRTRKIDKLRMERNVIFGRLETISKLFLCFFSSPYSTPSWRKTTRKKKTSSSRSRLRRKDFLEPPLRNSKFRSFVFCTTFSFKFWVLLNLAQFSVVSRFTNFNYANRRNNILHCYR